MAVSPREVTIMVLQAFFGDFQQRVAEPFFFLMLKNSKIMSKTKMLLESAMNVIPRNATILSANGKMKNGVGSFSYTYRHDGQIFTATFSKEGGSV